MIGDVIIDVIIPAFNEEKSIGKVIDEIPASLVRDIIVCNNNSTDGTSKIASDHGATVVNANVKGYGSACLEGMHYIAKKDVKPTIVVFMDGDYSDYPAEMTKIVHPIIEENYDLVIGSRAIGKLEKGSMTPQQIFGNWLATTLIKLFYKYEFTDLGPFRAINYQKLLKLEMKDPNFGWTVEMQVKAAKMKYKCIEIPVKYRKRMD